MVETAGHKEAMDPIMMRMHAKRTLDLRLPRLDAQCSCTNAVNDIDGIEAAAAQLRREHCSKAAAVRLGKAGSSDDDELDDDEDDETATCHIRVQTIPVASSIGGKIWDASLLMSVWLETAQAAQLIPPAATAGARRPRVLEVGAGLGVVGLAAAKHFPWLHVTLSDYDVDICDNLHHNIGLNFTLPLAEKTLDVEALDFRDFTTVAMAEVPLPPALQRHVASGLFGQVDLIIGADVVYERTHVSLAQVCLALLGKPENAPPDTPPPAAVFMANNSRPYIRDFVAGLEAAGLDCRIERVHPSEVMVRRLRRAYDGWGIGASFSIFVVTRRLDSAVDTT